MNAEYETMQEEIYALLQTHASSEYAKETLALHVAKTSLLMNHLYEDLGFESRTQMGAFMKEHFPTLAALKPKESLWKKFLYDTIGKVAPACATCDDSHNCFKCMLKESA